MAAPEISADIVEVLKKPNPAVMATTRADGAPVSVATWYMWADGRILLNLDGERKRLEHLRRDPRVSLTVLDEDGWNKHVSMQGTVTLEADVGLARIDSLAHHYTGKPYYNRERERVNAWLDIDSVHTWGYENRTQATADE